MIYFEKARHLKKPRVSPGFFISSGAKVGLIKNLGKMPTLPLGSTQRAMVLTTRRFRLSVGSGVHLVPEFDVTVLRRRHEEVGFGGDAEMGHSLAMHERLLVRL